ncbi:hypothetical protein ACFWPH_28560 [Nocardia sp. NPDC058499]|uniref:hypothetical protein n=1 Tax=Nocardia sp. NPDC058499 TaxID=3346530 RepID=UPI0036603449
MGESSSPAAPHDRAARASKALDLDPEAMIDAICDFTATARPAGPLAKGLLAALTTRLDLVPVGSLATVNDLYDAATDTDASHEHLPPIPESLPGAVAYLDVALSRLTASEIHAIAQQLSLPRASAELACRLLTPRESAPLYEVIRDNDPAEDARKQRYRTAVAATMTAISTEDRDRWGRRELDVLRLALRLHAARIGDGYLRVSEWPTTTLTWHHHPSDRYTATLPVPGAPNPLEAIIEATTPDPRISDTRTELFAPHRTTAPTGYTWQIGWHDDSAEFQRYLGQREASAAAAKFAVEAGIGELAQRADTLRGPTGEVLVPYSPTAHAEVDLQEVLAAVSSEFRPPGIVVHGFGTTGPAPPSAPENTDTMWAMTPHRRPDTPLASIVAAVLDQLGLPWPHPGDPACTANVDSEEFTAFLARQSVTLTGQARTYLASMADAGPGEQPLSARHSNGWRAVLAEAEKHTGSLESVLPPPSFGYPLLSEIAMLALYFDEHP